MKKAPIQRRKVRDHDHYSGEYRGAAHSACNFRLRRTFKIPVFFHNFRGYDAHIISLALNNFRDIEISPIAQSMEKYLMLGWNNHLIFKDSFQFIGTSLDTIVKNTVAANAETLSIFSNEITNPELQKLFAQKGVFPYDWFDDIKKLQEPALPPIEQFYSRLRQSGLSAEEYERAKNIWKHGSCKIFKDYLELYNKSGI